MLISKAISIVIRLLHVPSMYIVLTVMHMRIITLILT